MRFFTIILIVIFLCLCTISELYAQNFRQQRMELQQKQQQTRQDIQSLRRQISTYQQDISRTAERYDQAYGRYQALQREISLRDAVIATLSEERRHMEAELTLTRENIDALRKELEQLIENYKQTLRYIYKNGRTPETALLLTANSFNQMLRRSFYLRKFEQHRENQARLIEESRKALAEQEQELLVLIRRNQANLQESRNEQIALASRMEEQESLIRVLRQDRRSLEGRLAQTQSEISGFEQMLTVMIDEEERIRKAEEVRLRELEEERQRRLVAAGNIRNPGAEPADPVRTAPRVSGALPTQDDLNHLEQSFGRQKGRLPFPVDAGAVSSRFGNRVHPLYGTQVNNPGVDIATASRNEVRVVHDGYVFEVRAIPGYGDMVFVNHGKYKTVYGNLSDVKVRNNQFLRAGDVLGLSGDEYSLRGPTVFFMIRDGSTNVDPESWFARN